MEKSAVDWETHLDNRIPITRDDTRRSSIARTLHEAAERAKADENAVQVKAAGQERVWCMAERQRKEGEVYIVPTKKKTAELLQQPSGTPRFGKRRRHLRTV